jgi:single-strand DNA-binding protein
MGWVGVQIGRHRTPWSKQMNDTFLTIVGNVVDAPRMRLTKNGHAVTNFRVASTSRRWDRENERYVDNSSLFVNVTCWRGMAENVAQSLHKGQPVIVTGRYYSREYTVNEVLRIAYELEAIAVGHDLSRGVSEFRKVIHSRSTSVEVDEGGLPADRSDEWLGLQAADSLATDDVQAEIDAAFDAETSTAVG